MDPTSVSFPVAVGLALLLGLACTDLFYRFWKGFLGCLAAIHLLVGGRITRPQFLQRLGLHLVTALGSCVILVLAFRLYLQLWSLGHSETEQVVFFLGCMARLVPLMFVIKREIEALFDTR